MEGPVISHFFDIKYKVLRADFLANPMTQWLRLSTQHQVSQLSSGSVETSVPLLNNIGKSHADPLAHFAMGGTDSGASS